jgi:hypothetical protein
MTPIPMIIVKRQFYDAFDSGEKTTEYRRHRGLFTARTFWTGRSVRIAYSYNVKRYPSLIALVEGLDVELAETHLERLRAHYPDLQSTDEIALIHLQVIERHGPGG